MWGLPVGWMPERTLAFMLDEENFYRKRCVRAGGELRNNRQLSKNREMGLRRRGAGSRGRARGAGSLRTARRNRALGSGAGRDARSVTRSAIPALRAFARNLHQRNRGASECARNRPSPGAFVL